MVELTEIVDIIKSLDYISDVESLKPDSTFKNNGIDSLDVMSILLAVEEKYGIKIPDEDLDKVNTPNDLLGYLNAKLS